ncbi:hypothetical protein GC163_19825 [bacterium]|nr:hypothetical protein [bacterium]
MSQALVETGHNSSGEVRRACWQLFTLTLRRQLLSRQTLVCLALTVVVGAIVLAWTFPESRTAKKLAEQVLIPTYVAFLMPIFAISYGAAAIGGEREDQTLIYLLMTPLPRALAYGVKALATLVLVWGWSIVSLGSFCLLAGNSGRELFPLFLPGALLGGTAYAMLFMLIGTLFRYGTMISLAYWFFLEVLFGAMPGIVKRVTVSYYVKCLVFDAGSEIPLGPRGRVQREMFLAVSGETAMTVMIAAAVGFILLGATIFHQREFSELG